MKESQKLHIKEFAKEWGCKIEDPMSFQHHYNQYMTYKMATALTFVGFGLLILLSIII